MNLRVIALPLVLAVMACGSAKDNKEESIVGASAGNSIASNVSPLVNQATEESAPITNSETVYFSCLGFKSGQYDTEIVLSDFAVGGDHMGPVATYKVTGHNEFNGATGSVRLFNPTGDDSGDEYEFLDGHLGQLKAKIVPSSQGFFDILIGDKGAQCEKGETDN
ncbi:MAG TPA: hypothetical protein VJ762_09640 [Sphingobium sp.]|nr:hypothetical protein [Sphingobium sp.]